MHIINVCFKKTLFLSRYILDNKTDYYSSLIGISQRGNWTNWILFMLRTIEKTSNNTFNKINEIVSAKNSFLEYIIKDKRKFQNPDRFIEFLLINH